MSYGVMLEPMDTVEAARSSEEAYGQYPPPEVAEGSAVLAVPATVGGGKGGEEKGGWKLALDASSLQGLR